MKLMSSHRSKKDNRIDSAAYPGGTGPSNNTSSGYFCSPGYWQSCWSLAAAPIATWAARTRWILRAARTRTVAIPNCREPAGIIMAMMRVGTALVRPTKSLRITSTYSRSPGSSAPEMHKANRSRSNEASRREQPSSSTMCWSSVRRLTMSLHLIQRAVRSAGDLMPISVSSNGRRTSSSAAASHTGATAMQLRAVHHAY